jgi:hypothetical protein
MVIILILADRNDAWFDKQENIDFMRGYLNIWFCQNV